MHHTAPIYFDTHFVLFRLYKVHSILLVTQFCCFLSDEIFWMKTIFIFILQAGQKRVYRSKCERVLRENRFCVRCFYFD